MLKPSRKQKQYKTVAIPIGLWKEISRVIETTELYNSEAEFVRSVVRNKLEELAVIEAEKSPQVEVTKRILQYIKEKGKVYPSDITVELGIPYFTAIAIIEKLSQEGMLEIAEEGGKS